MTRKFLRVALLIVFTLAACVSIRLVAQELNHVPSADVIRFTDAPAIEFIQPLQQDPSPDRLVKSMERSLKSRLIKRADRVIDQDELAFVDDKPARWVEGFDRAELDRARRSPHRKQSVNGKSARDRKSEFLQLASEFVNLNNETDLQLMTEELRIRIAEESARQKVLELEQLLKHVTTKFPATRGARRAERMLQSGGEVAVRAPVTAVRPTVPDGNEKPAASSPASSDNPFFQP